MSTALSLFPARIRFVNQDGTLTPEAYRAMQMLYGRTGGVLGDMGVDTFATGFGGDLVQGCTGLETVTQPVNADWIAPDVLQPASTDWMAPEVLQPAVADVLLPDVTQPTNERSNTAAESVTPSGSPYTFRSGRDGYVIVQGGMVSRIDYVRLGVATQIGSLAGLFPLLSGDGLQVTYTVAPTMTFIPR